MRQLIIWFFVLATLGGCGFQLRGSNTVLEEFETQRIHVDHTGAPGVTAQLRAALADSGTTTASNLKQSDYAIRLAGERVTRDVLSVSPQTGKVEEFQLTYVVLLTLQHVGGAVLLERVPIMLQRDFTFDQDAVLGNFSEEEILRDELTRDAADQVMRRTAAAIRRDKQAPAP